MHKHNDVFGQFLVGLAVASISALVLALARAGWTKSPAKRLIPNEN